MSISREDVTYVADLVRIEFDGAETDRLADELGAILNYMETLDQLDTSGVKPTEHILPVQNVFRKDEVKPSLPIEEVLANAPVVEAGCFKVPRVVE
ncbi:Asp-tRNA(Asn)/Glu-tRNA(Gln) amidotransferase subunit GatC [Eubacterium aggregans]|uniref:Asp-tRNA(Asn)/Glu-tRNA(Gln) amidotransferase subunit GatC n=1 Tax=Eubacterium aggregans TaxID=81409 RepID=UPI003F389F64